MLASTIQFSHNTPHKTTTRKSTNLIADTHAGYNQGTMPQTPNNAPSTSINVLVNQSHWLRCISTRLSFGGSETFVHINHQPHNTHKCMHCMTYSTNWCLKLKLLRKEVIHPHLPVRVPCYDFVPIADPTFDSSLTSLGHWLRVLPTFMT